VHLLFLFLLLLLLLLLLLFLLGFELRALLGRHFTTYPCPQANKYIFCHYYCADGNNYDDIKGHYDIVFTTRIQSLTLSISGLAK
jgi:hypothetical protein